MYKKVQFIAYCIDTFPHKENANQFGVNVATLNGNPIQLFHFQQRVAYLGVADSKIDITNRCKILERVLAKAWADTSVAGTDPNCLKLFMVPEFYFRGRKGAYELEDAIELVGQLRNMVQADKWRDWMFVFGSILARYRDSTGTKVLNIVPVQKGAQGEAGSRVIMKEFKSGIDFISKTSTFSTDDNDPTADWVSIHATVPKGSLLDHRVQHPESGKATRIVGNAYYVDENRGAGKEQQKKNYDGLGIFSMEQLSFGMEICLDHLMQRLRKSPPSRMQRRIQIQLIPSAGMDIKPTSVLACRNGHVFNCDGGSGGHSAVSTVSTPIGDNADLKSAATLKNVAMKKSVDLPASLNGVNVSNFYNNNGQLHIYPSLVIPPATYVGA